MFHRNVQRWLGEARNLWGMHIIIEFVLTPFVWQLPWSTIDGCAQKTHTSTKLAMMHQGSFLLFRHPWAWCRIWQQQITLIIICPFAVARQSTKLKDQTDPPEFHTVPLHHHHNQPLQLTTQWMDGQSPIILAYLLPSWLHTIKGLCSDPLGYQHTSTKPQFHTPSKISTRQACKHQNSDYMWKISAYKTGHKSSNLAFLPFFSFRTNIFYISYLYCLCFIYIFSLWNWTW